jgi:glycosyltransferase involved in cell wall biosynthesis
MKLACVIHRYGTDIAGGSEAHCRQLAERLSSQHNVTVLTSCARDYLRWANAYAPGTSLINGVTVARFPVTRRRNLKTFAELSDEVFAGRASPERQEAWVRENGPMTPALLEHLRTHRSGYDLVLFWSFRYYPTYFGLPMVADRAVLVPTAEEDPAIKLDMFQPFFRTPGGYLFLTPEEKALVSTRAGACLEPSTIVGAGLEPMAVSANRTPIDAIGIPPSYVLYLGRIDNNKGCYTMFEYFEEYLASGGADTTLVLVGPATIPVPMHPRIRALGFVDEPLKTVLLSHARALLIPSPYESLSIALLEAWNARVPAIVNGACRVLKGQVTRANGGLYYRSSREFSEALSYILTHPDEARAIGEQGLAYVEREYRWPVVMERVDALLREVRTRRS